MLFDTTAFEKGQLSRASYEGLPELNCESDSFIPKGNHDQNGSQGFAEEVCTKIISVTD